MIRLRFDFVRTIIFCICIVAIAVFVYVAYFQPFVEPTEPRMRFKAQGEIDALEFSMITFATHTNFTGVLEDNNRLNNDRLFAIFQAWTNAITARSLAST